MWYLLNQPENTGNIFNEQEIASIINVIKYFNGNPYNSETLDNDIKKTYNCSIFNPGHEKMLELYQILLIKLNQIDISVFTNLLFNEETNIYYKKVLKPALLNNIISYYPYSYFLKNIIQKFSIIKDNKIENFFELKNIIKLSNYPNKPQEFISNYQKALSHYLNPHFNPYNFPEKAEENQISLGQFAEFLVYNLETDLIKNNNDLELIWVSNILDDGFGYDLMLINHKTNETRLIEVKGTFEESYKDYINLTPNELNICQSTKTNPNTDYVIYRLYYVESTNIMYYKIYRNSQMEEYEPYPLEEYNHFYEPTYQKTYQNKPTKK